MLITTLPAFAVDVVVETCPKDSPFSALCNLKAERFNESFSAVLALLLIAAVVLALVFLIYGGIKWILSGGDKTAVEGARNHIIAAIVGLIIAFAAFFILNIILHLFLGRSITEITLPRL